MARRAPAPFRDHASLHRHGRRFRQFPASPGQTALGVHHSGDAGALGHQRLFPPALASATGFGFQHG